MPDSVPIRFQASRGVGSTGKPGLGAMLCADVGCGKRSPPTVTEIADLIQGDNELSAAIDARISGSLHDYGDARFDEQAQRFDAIDASIDVNSAAIKRMEDSTAGIVEMMTSWAGAMKAIEAIGKILKPLTWIIGFFTALVGFWAALRGIKGDA